MLVCAARNRQLSIPEGEGDDVVEPLRYHQRGSEGKERPHEFMRGSLRRKGTLLFPLDFGGKRDSPFVSISGKKSLLKVQSISPTW